MLRTLLPAFVLCALSSSPLRAGNMYVESCNLGCNSGAGGTQVFGTIVGVPENQTLRVTFSLEVDLASVNGVSFRVFNVANGIAPPGNYSVDLLDPRTVIFEPALSFDAGGNPSYGFLAGAVYGIFIPGTAQGDSAPFIRSTTGMDNESRLQHTISADQGIQTPIFVSCETSPNSVGPGAQLQILGSNSIGANNLSFLTGSAPPQVPGIYFVGTQPRSLPMGQGIRCAGGQLKRLGMVMTDLAGGAQRSLDLDLVAPGPGDRRYFQFWYRDTSSAGSPTSNLSNAVSVRFYP